MADQVDTPNEALVRRTFELFNARDAEGIVALMHPDGELFPYAIDERRPDGYQGHDGLRQYVADVGRVFAEFHVDIEEIRDVGEGVVFAQGRLVGRTADDLRIDMAASWLWTIEDGLVTRMQAHPVTPGPDG